MSNSNEVSQPILNSPFSEPECFWYLREGETPQKREGRRPSFVFEPRDQRNSWTTDGRILGPSALYTGAYELVMVNLIRERLKAWENSGYAGATRTTTELLTYWQDEGREKRLFYAQLEAAKTIIFLTEARQDFLQGITVPRDEPSAERKSAGYSGFLRYACKMATGAGKTTVMGMLTAWSILNKVASRGDKRFSDVVVVVCPNVTIRDRLTELQTDAEKRASIEHAIWCRRISCPSSPRAGCWSQTGTSSSPRVFRRTGQRSKSAAYL